MKLNGFITILITNQSVINRNMVTWEGLEYIHNMLKTAVRDQGGEITDIFFCPHVPEDQCDCRKPQPGLIYQARDKYRIDIAKAVMVGDSAKDIECARNAGCRYAILVRTGNGPAAEKALKVRNIVPDYVAQDLLGAVEWIISQYKKRNVS